MVFVVDSSGSIREQNVEGEMDNWQKLKLFLTNVVDRLDIAEDKVGVFLLKMLYLIGPDGLINLG